MERQKIILVELQSPQRLSEVLDVIDVVLAFLASAGAGNPKISLGDYVKKTLKMTRRTLPKVSHKMYYRYISSLLMKLEILKFRCYYSQL